MKIILDLCGGTGAWSKPYADAGYDVRVITLPGDDVRLYRPPDNVYGILAAPPCPMFSFARTKAKKPRDLKAGMEIVTSCMNIIWKCIYTLKSDNQKYSPLKFWALENPYYGMLKWFLGLPAFIFDPYDFKDAYKKRTALWGLFKSPIKAPVDPAFNRDHNHSKLPKFDYMKSRDIHPEHYGKLTRTERRAITPPGFAKAFFEANR